MHSSQVAETVYTSLSNWKEESYTQDDTHHFLTSAPGMPLACGDEFLTSETRASNISWLTTCERCKETTAWKRADEAAEARAEAARKKEAGR